MQKTFKLLLTGCVATTMLMASAMATNFDDTAVQLQDLGLFQGSTSGFELDRAPTRAEAGTMLVRLLGKEAEAQALTYTAPFTDLDDWQKPYVQYLYDNGLTTGATATTFEPEESCDAQMYTTFLLRALGYSDANGDFSYAEAITKGAEISLVDYANCDESDFLRDHVVAMSYTALSISPNGVTATTLLDKLVSEGAVDSEAAADTQDLFTAYKKYAAFSNTINNQNRISLTTDMTASYELNDVAYMTMSSVMQNNMDMNINDMNSSTFSTEGTTKLTISDAFVQEGMDQEIEIETLAYYTDGMYYVNDGTNKIKMPLDFESIIGEFDIYENNSDPVSVIKSITVTDGEYVVEYYDSAVNVVFSKITVADSLLTSGLFDDMAISELNVVLNAEDGELVSIETNVNITGTIEDQGTISMDIQSISKDIYLGSDVVVTIPTDLDTYLAQ